jgi:hypothetical protein
MWTRLTSALRIALLPCVLIAGLANGWLHLDAARATETQILLAGAAGNGSSSGSSSSSSSSSSTSSSGSSSSSSSSSSGAVFGVKASGSKLVSTLNGAQVTLIGASMQGCDNEFQPAWCAATASLAPSFWGGTWKTQRAGTNTVRLQLDVCAYVVDSACATGANSSYPTQVQQIVANAIAGGLYVMISAQDSAITGHVSTGQPSFLDSTHGIPFWTAMANLYGHNPAVIFDIFNEPYGLGSGVVAYNNWFYVGSPYNSSATGVDTAVVGAGGTYNPWVTMNESQSLQAPVYVNWTVYGELQALTLIRSLGANNLVLLSPTGFAGEIENWLYTYQTGCGADPVHNCGASQHMYGYSFGMTPVAAVVSAGFPVVETEFESTSDSSIGGCASGCYSLSQIQSWGASGFINCCPHDNGTPVMAFGNNSYSGGAPSTW